MRVLETDKRWDILHLLIEGNSIRSTRPLPLLYALTSEGKSRELLKLAAQFTVKRILDYIGAGLGVLLLSPLMLGIALLILLDSRGPVLFRQQRLGLGGKPFWLWKFRTMVVDAEDRLGGLEHLNESQGGVLFKIRHDPRVTRIGRLLRRTSLDELPQLFNVLQGHMSLVGPRPLPLRDCERLQEIDGQQFQWRHSVLPGLTGPWQVSGRSGTGYYNMIILEYEYINKWSFCRDLQLIGRTIIVLASCRGAY
jgi:lipopolysaccharide/colanic/teichoic acid biosynthesis glycosyltransferase